jgi:chemotaxis protein histidine kinase CheA
MFKPDDELVNGYLDESREQLATMEEDLLAMEGDGTAFEERRINRAFRAVHSIKGGADIFNLNKISELAHHTENVLSLIRSHKIAPTPERVQVLLGAVDSLNELVRDAANSEEADLSAVLAALATIYNGHGASKRKAVVEVGGPKDPGSDSLRVLLVEDDFACRLLLQTFLSRYGECHVAVNGCEAVAAFRAALDQGRSYNLVCMDIMMPEMNGREAVRQIRTLEEVKEVFLCFKELCDAYLIKPIDLGQLLKQMDFYQLLK